MEVGQRVVRGENWKWGDQDGGEGSVGTVVVVGKHGSLSSPDKTVIVQWDTGMRTNYRCGHDNAYDLFLLDNAPSGVLHLASCNECNEQQIKGMLWQCAECSLYNLCSVCYNNGKHSLEHKFLRVDTPNSIPVMVNKRQGGHKIQSKGTFAGAVVKRGPDWDWGNQDGGPQEKGLVTDVKGWDNQTFHSVVSVTWVNSEGNVYRRGHKGKVDVISTSPSEGGFYYKDHLPKLGYPFPVSRDPSRQKPSTIPHPLQHRFRKGDKVRILLDVDVLKSLQTDCGGWNDRMKSVIGMAGTVYSTAVSNNGIVVAFPLSNTCKMVVNPLALSKVETFQVNDKVFILNNLALVKKLQASHGEWTENMKHILGKKGQVIKIYPDGDIRVSVGNSSWTLNPAVLCKTVTDAVDTSSQAPPSPQGSISSSSTPSVTSLVGAMTINEDNITATLLQAAGQGHCGKVREILGVDPSKVNSSQDGKTALHMSSHEGHVNVVNLLLNSRANSNIQDDDGDTALHYAAFCNKPLVASTLLQHGANIDMLNKNGLTPLHISVNRGHADVVQILIDAGCNVNIQDSSGDTALHDAITNDRQDIITRLIDSDRCDLTLVNQQGFSAFHRAALKGRQQVMVALLHKSPVLLNSAKDDGFTALHLSSLNGHLGLVTYLLAQNGCDINFVNSKNQTALLLAVDKTHKDIVKTLLEHNADPNIQDDVGDTPLHTAAANQYFHGNTSDSNEADIIRLLMQNGADPTLHNHDNKTAIDLCHDVDLVSLMRIGASTSTQLPEDLNSLPSLPQECKPTSVSMTTSDSCRLCGNPIDCEFKPCGHRVVCHGCSNMFKACCECKAPIESISKLDESVVSECKVCSEAKANVVFEPCLHVVVCTECCVRMKKCFVCQKTIHRKTTTDGIIINQEPDKYGQNMDSLFYLQAKVQEMEEAQICAICMENKRTIAFLCGHSTCDVCCESLSDCPWCRKPIEKRIKLFH